MEPEVGKFLDLIAWSEGTSVSPLTMRDGYDVIVTGVDGPEIFVDFTHHPFSAWQSRPARASKLIRPGLYSTAAGRYQVLRHWFEEYQKMLNLPDFSPLSQDAVAVQQIKERKAIPMILAGNIVDAIQACSNIWASFPGNLYGQNAHSSQKLMARWDAIKTNGLEIS